MNIHEFFTYLRVKNASKAIEFYEQLFGAKEKFRLVEPNGRIGHAELDLGRTTLMLSEEFPELNLLGPQSLEGSDVTLHLHVDNADQLIAKAVEMGAKVIRHAQDHFYGERSGTIVDPFGYHWNIGHEIEKLSPEEMQKRYTALFQQNSPS